MKRTIVAMFLVIVSFFAFSQQKSEPKTGAQPQKKEAAVTMDKDTLVVFETDLGKIVFEFFPDKAPGHVKNFIELSQSGFYNGTRFHRTVPGFMIQGGDPNTKVDDPSKPWGTGGNVGPDGREKMLKAEFNDVHHARGVLSMARSSDPDSASSQFFVCVADAGFLDRKYTAFGKVIEGMEVADKIVSAPAGPKGPRDPEGSRPVKPVSVKKAYAIKRSEYKPAAAPAAPAK
ncbi:MAG TPA: peptidylprolyl isomerase [Acidobacteriota bacterium]|nr:peptidylprolyl isomerase [Acidobacteriota bacterium]HNT16742.1 peptidylprolyl isomerase [Acidobacteriota bacterium]HQO19995.1 peptidylprolyl isomerase [Acidobacteriota bacterium]